MRLLSFALTFLLSIHVFAVAGLSDGASAPAALLATPEIHVMHAAWGSHDATAKADEFCKGKSDCWYKVSEKYLGQVSPDDYKKSFVITFKCSMAANAKIQTATADAGQVDGKVLHLNCPVPPLSPAELKALFGSRTTTFRQILLDPSQHAQMVSDLGQDCADTINQLSREGKNLSSTTLRAALVPLSSIHFASGVQDMTFYHYTKAVQVVNDLVGSNIDPQAAFNYAAHTHGFEKIFKYLRTAPVTDDNALWHRVLYVAEDPATSAGSGNYEIEFKLDPNARTLSPDYQVWFQAMKEVNDRYPMLGLHCHMAIDQTFATTYGNVYYNSMFFIVAEDSGVDVIDYTSGEHWFQVVSSTPFRGVRWANHP